MKQASNAGEQLAESPESCFRLLLSILITWVLSSIFFFLMHLNFLSLGFHRSDSRSAGSFMSWHLSSNPKDLAEADKWLASTAGRQRPASGVCCSLFSDSRARKQRHSCEIATEPLKEERVNPRDSYIFNAASLKKCKSIWRALGKGGRGGHCCKTPGCFWILLPVRLDGKNLDLELRLATTTWEPIWPPACFYK